MAKLKTKKQFRLKRHKRVRMIIAGTAERPRVSVFKSNRHIFVQAIDDENRKTIVSASDIILKAGAKAKIASNKTETAQKIGDLLAAKMQEKKIKEAIFDRGGFAYHGRIKAIADSLRKGGIKI